MDPNLPPMAQPQVEKFVLEFQEERLQKVEERVSECASSIAVTGERVESLQETTKNGFERIEDLVKKLAEGAIPAFQAFQAGATHRLEKLEAANNRRDARIAAAKKAFWAIALAVVGALAKGAVDNLVKR